MKTSLVSCTETEQNNTHGKHTAFTSATSRQKPLHMRTDCEAQIQTSGWRPWIKNVRCLSSLISPLNDPVTWYGINYAGTQVTHWDFWNNGTCTSPTRFSFVLKVPLRHNLFCTMWPCQAKGLLIINSASITFLRFHWPDEREALRTLSLIALAVTKKIYHCRHFF